MTRPNRHLGAYGCAVAALPFEAQPDIMVLELLGGPVLEQEGLLVDIVHGQVKVSVEVKIRIGHSVR